MKTISFTESRKNYAAVLDAVLADREATIVTRAGHEPVVIVSLDEYNSMQETAYLMRSPHNATRLLEATRRLREGQGDIHDLADTPQAVPVSSDCV